MEGTEPTASAFAPAIAHHAALDARMAKAARAIRLLSLVSWPAGEQQAFLADFARGQARLPAHQYPKHDFSDERREFDAIAAAADPAHPLGVYLIESARSWAVAAELLENLGSPRVTELSVALFGKPDYTLPGGATTREAANHFIASADELDRELLAPSEQVAISATSLGMQLQAALDDYFDARVISVELDPELIAKAAAGPNRIRLRAGAAFSDYDLHQLLQHEAFVHSLTALNGREQPHLTSLGLNTPRITATQEGLATFAELITGTIDIGRMKRISLRIIAIDMALKGADFIDVFRFFLDSGQTEADSFTSAMRVFRGVPVTGGHAFTKDTVYLHGLLSVHTFFRWALKNQRLKLVRYLFAGKMALHDVLSLEPYFDSGWIAPALYIPHWVARANGLAGMLAFSLFANRIRLDRVEAEDLVLGL